MQKLVFWAKSHKIAAGAIGCGGLIVVGFVIRIIAGLILTAVGYEPEEAGEPEAVATIQAPPPAPETTPPAPQPEPTTAEPEASPTHEPEETTEAPEKPVDHMTTLDYINATHEVYTGDYRYLMVTGREPAGMWAFSYDKPTVEAIATGSPIISDIWELADRSFDPR